jgi:hypothetical protein
MTMANPQQTNDDTPTPDEVASLLKAPRAILVAKARGDCADSLVLRLVSDITASETASGQRKNARRKGLEKLNESVAAFIADLLHGRNHPESDGWVYRPMSNGSFSGQAVSSRVFRGVVGAWMRSGLLDHKPGFVGTVEFDPGDPIRTRGKTARFRATHKLLDVCAEHGVTPQNAGEHFHYPPPEHPLVLTATSRRVGSWKEAGAVMEFERTPHTEKLEEAVRELNGFLAQHLIRGATHRWLTRRFNEGDHPAFDWDRGGRLYSEGKDSYQQLPRCERLKITIDGEPVCEIDIRASYLTILHAQYNQPFKVSEQDDPYDIEGIPRSVVKKWCAVRFGTKNAFTKWPPTSIKEYAEDNNGADLTQYRVRQIGKLVCEKHPLLKRWTDLKETWADLMWLESNAVISAMLQLRSAQDAPSLPIHDSLLVPVRHEDWAKTFLASSYHYHCKAKPHLTVHRP